MKKKFSKTHFEILQKRKGVTRFLNQLKLSLNAPEYHSKNRNLDLNQRENLMFTYNVYQLHCEQSFTKARKRTWATTTTKDRQARTCTKQDRTIPSLPLACHLSFQLGVLFLAQYSSLFNRYIISAMVKLLSDCVGPKRQ